MFKIKTRQITLAAMMAALSIALDQLSLHNNTTKVTLYSFPLLLTGLMFGPLVGGIAGFVAGFIIQLLYGLDITTPLWMLAPIAWGLISGLISYSFKNKRSSLKAVVIIVLVTSLACTAINTGCLYLDGLIKNYPTPYVIAQLGTRIFTSLVLCIPYTYALFAIMTELKNTRYYLDFEQK